MPSLTRLPTMSTLKSTTGYESNPAAQRSFGLGAVVASARRQRHSLSRSAIHPRRYSSSHLRILRLKASARGLSS